MATIIPDELERQGDPTRPTTRAERVNGAPLILPNMAAFSAINMAVRRQGQEVYLLDNGEGGPGSYRVGNDLVSLVPDPDRVASQTAAANASQSATNSQTEASKSATSANIALNAVNSAVNGVLLYALRSELYANLTPADGVGARVVSDLNLTYNGFYKKTGGPGTGSWTYIGADPVVAYAAQPSGSTLRWSGLYNPDGLNGLLIEDCTVSGRDPEAWIKRAHSLVSAKYQL